MYQFSTSLFQNPIQDLTLLLVAMFPWSTIISEALQSFLVFYDLDNLDILDEYWSVFGRMPLNTADAFSWLIWGYEFLARILKKSCVFISASYQCTSKAWYVLLRVLLSLIIWLSWCLLGFLDCKVTISVINIIGEILLDHVNFLFLIKLFK